MKSKEFLEKLKLAASSKTLYVMGCFGAPMNETNKKRYKNNNAYNRRPDRQQMIENATYDTFGFDCVCLIKGILWGWNAKTTATYGGASYASNGVPDIGADTMITKCPDASSSGWDKIQPGEVVWKEGHIGVYVGNGKVIESTPIWDNCVQYSNLGNAGYTTGHYRNWTKHGHLPYVDYTDQEAPEAPTSDVYKLTVSGSITERKVVVEAIKGVIEGYGFQCSVEEVSSLQVGDEVRMERNAPVYGKNYHFSVWVYDKVLYVLEISGDRVVVSLEKNGDVIGAVNKKYLRRV